MEMKVLNGLATVLADIGYNSVTVFKSHLFGNFGNCLKNCGNICGVVRANLVARADMLTGNNQDVYGRLGIYIVECVNLVV